MHITIDEETVKAIDEVAGPRGRSRYIREAIAERVDVDRRIAARRRAAGSIPDFAPWMTPERISEDRRRETAMRDEKLSEQRRRED